ncbi:MAG: hypothetical protein AAGF11_00335 [Myxococcota bacterium]
MASSALRRCLAALLGCAFLPLHAHAGPVVLSEPAGAQPECVLAYYDATTEQTVEIEFCSPDLEGDPTLTAGQSLRYFSRIGPVVSPQCLANGWNMQFGVLYADGFEAPKTVYASCEPSLDPENDCPVE